MKIKKEYICVECGAKTPKWLGQCSDCLSWGSVQEETISVHSKKEHNIISSGNILDIELLDQNYTELPRYSTSIEELDRVLGGGLVPGSVILIGGAPGIGKSTLLLQLTHLANNTQTLYVTAEESVNQVKLRAVRLGITSAKSKIVSTNSVEDSLATLAHYPDIKLLIIDSIQTIQTSYIDSTPGTVSQVKSSAHTLINYAKKNDVILIIVGHVTKEGQLAGPKLLEHMVDTVLYFESDPQHHFRILRSMKNRFGNVNEIGVFSMTQKGLEEVKNPSEVFLSHRNQNISGTSIFASIEGVRPILVEIQALLAPSNMPMPKRSVIGWDANRLSMILAVLAVRSKLNLMNYEVYLTVMGGLKISEPAGDLAVASALISAATSKPLPHNSIFFGEISLSGEIRKSVYFESRVKESRKLGFDHIICRSDDQDVTNIDHISALYNLIR